MPAYNESKHVVSAVLNAKKQFETICPDYEIIVVDDGSTDDTRRVVQSIADDKVRIVAYDRNKGKGHALKSGFTRATGEFSFLVDSDSEIWAPELRDYVRALESAEIAIGSKRHPLSVVETVVVRRVLSIGYNVLERVLTGVRTTDTQAGFKAFKSSALYRILPLVSAKRYAFDLEILAVATLLKLRIVELPVHVELKGSASIGIVFRMLIDTLGIAYRLRLRRWYQTNIKKMASTYRAVIPW